MRAGWFALGLATFALSLAVPLACGPQFTYIDDGSGAGGTGGIGGMGGFGGTPVIPCENGSVEKCPGADVGCAIRVCTNGLCGTENLPADELLDSQIYGDCKVIKCDGEGHAVTTAAADLYDDGNPCTKDTCASGIVKNDPILMGTCPPTSTSPNGKVCDSNGKCVECLAGGSASFGCTTPETCSQGKCVPSTCINNLVDGSETDKDCGGPECLPCENGLKCIVFKDCVSLLCDSVLKTCKTPACDDNVMNGLETDQDCGGKTCVEKGLACLATLGCKIGSDCQSKVCKAGNCLSPSCADGVQNGMETGVDCGGPCEKKACPPPAP
jgi:hypothetical protein